MTQTREPKIESMTARALPVTNGDVQTGASKGGPEAETVHPVGKGQERESSDRKIQSCED